MWLLFFLYTVWYVHCQLVLKHTHNSRVNTFWRSSFLSCRFLTKRLSFISSNSTSFLRRPLFCELLFISSVNIFALLFTNIHQSDKLDCNILKLLDDMVLRGNGNINSYNEKISLTEILKNKTCLVFEFMILFHVYK